MRERAETLAGMGPAENPMATSENTWSYSMALKRARAYYRHRAASEAAADGFAEEQARSALRKRFYEYARMQVDKAHAIELPDGTVDISLPLLPRNTDEMKETELYTDASYVAADGALHAWEGCPGINTPSGFGSLSQLDAGEFTRCGACGLDASAMGNVAAASTSIDNGFEHHFRKVAESSAEYQRAKNEAMGQAGEVKHAVEGVLDMLNDAVAEAAGNRVEAYPPGRHGALAALAGDMGAEGGNAFFSGSSLGTYAAVSAAILVDDQQSDALANLLSGVADDIGPPLSDGGDMVLRLWSGLLSAYGAGTEGVCAGVEKVLDSIPLASASGLGSWASDALLSMLGVAGLEPANMASAKAVTSNTAPVAQRGDGAVAKAVRALKEDEP